LGVEKIIINSYNFHSLDLIKELSTKYGNQAVIASVDIKSNLFNNYTVDKNNGKDNTGLKPLEHIANCIKAGAGEILLTSMNNDGSKNGFALAITNAIGEAVSIPVIASGGAGNAKHFIDLFTKTEVSAGLAAGIFHFNELPISELKNVLKTQNIPIR
jgi:cyclase